MREPGEDELWLVEGIVQKDWMIRAALSHSLLRVEGQKASDPRALVSLLMGVPALMLSWWRRSLRVRLSFWGLLLWLLLFDCECVGDPVDVGMMAPDINPEPIPPPHPEE